MTNDSELRNADFARLFHKATREERNEEPTNGSALERDWGVGGNAMMQAAMRRNEEDWADADMDQDGDEDRPHAELGSTAFARHETKTVTTDEESHNQSSRSSTEDEKRRALSESELRRQFKWQRHTKGFGTKMLAKMGFTGRLGKDEKGVSTTLEVVQRPAQMGLGFGDFKEAGSLKQNKRVERELQGETYDEKEDAQAKRQEKSLVEDDSLWRKRKAPAGGRAHKRAADIRREAEEYVKKGRNEVILDMRGPDVRVLNQLSDAYDAGNIDAAEPKLGEELIYNVRMVVNLAQGRIYDLTQKIETNASTLESMRTEKEMLYVKVTEEDVHWKQVDEMMMKLAELEDVASICSTTLDVESVLHRLRDIRSSFSRVFEQYGIHQLVPSLTIPILKTLLLASDLFDPSSMRATVDQYRQIQLFLLELPTDRQGSLTLDNGIFNHFQDQADFIGDEVYNYILEETLWPAAVQLINIQWEVKNDSQLCAMWFETFRPHLSPAFVEAFLHQLVLPRLLKACKSWNPHQDETMIHDWLRPWKIHLGDALNNLYPEIQLALGNALVHWHPSDLSVLPVLTPWKAMWTETDYAKFTHRHIMKKLARCLQRDFRVDPHSQSLDALDWVFVWQDHIPERQLVALLEGEFFPEWLRVLRSWIASCPDLDELVAWYSGWKDFFRKHRLASHPRCVLHFHNALVLMDAAYSLLDQPTTPIPQLNPQAASTYQDALLCTRQATDGGVDEGLLAGANSKPRPSRAVSLKDLVEDLAISNNLTFMPKGTHDGQQVYLLGDHHIIIEQGVVYKEATKGQFLPVDVDTLVQ